MPATPNAAANAAPNDAVHWVECPRDAWQAFAATVPSDGRVWDRNTRRDRGSFITVNSA